MAESQLPTELMQLLRIDRRQRWLRGERIQAETYFQLHPALLENPALALELVYHEILLREELGEKPQLEEYARRFPQLAEPLRPLFEVHRAIESGQVLGQEEMGRE